MTLFQTKTAQNPDLFGAAYTVQAYIQENVLGLPES